MNEQPEFTLPPAINAAPTNHGLLPQLPTPPQVRAFYRQRGLAIDNVGAILSRLLTSQKLDPVTRRIIQDFFWFFPEARH